MKDETKPLKALSIEQIEIAIANAIAGLTNTDVNACISLFKREVDGRSALSGKEKFELSLSLEVGISHTYGLEKNKDSSFNL